MRLEFVNDERWRQFALARLDIITHQQLYALTSPLITTADGAKMGKTAKGAVWLNADMLSPYDYWQFWRNAADAVSSGLRPGLVLGIRTDNLAVFVKGNEEPTAALKGLDADAVAGAGSDGRGRPARSISCGVNSGESPPISEQVRAPDRTAPLGAGNLPRLPRAPSRRLAHHGLLPLLCPF